jgi:hypothetical protein
MFRTLPLSQHALTHIEVLKRFLNVQIDVQEEGGGANVVRIEPRKAQI